MMRFKHNYSEIAICWGLLFLMATLGGPPLPLFRGLVPNAICSGSFAGTDKVHAEIKCAEMCTQTRRAHTAE